MFTMQILAYHDYEEMSLKAADIFAKQIQSKPDSVLGLATGSTPLGMYAELVKLYERGELDFSRVTSVNLDEYYPISPEHPQSYHYFMNKNLFSRVNIDPARTFIPNGQCRDPKCEGSEYDARIELLGGIDIQLLGIGENGHIAFNEPADELIAGTHATSLTESTIHANSRFFDSEADVPTQALTMGMASILHARKIILLACGKNKHEAILALQNDKITPQIPATLLKLHPDVTVLCDREAYGL